MKTFNQKCEELLNRIKNKRVRKVLMIDGIENH